MNRLKKKAKQEFIAVCVFMAIVIPCFIVFVAKNTQGFDYIFIWLIVGVPTGLFVYLRENKKLKQLDERERSLYQQANYWAQGIFIFYLLAFVIVAFFLIGGQGKVPVWLLPMMLLTGLFLAQTTLSFILFRQCEKEDDE